MWLKSVIIITFCINQLLAFSTGAGGSSCGTLMPNHTENIPQETEAPYQIKLSSDSVAQTGLVDVTIEDPSGEFSFRGFVIQARATASPNQIVGTFFESLTTRNVACTPANQFPLASTSTHRNANVKTTISLRWQAPLGFQGEVEFRATVVYEFTTFWTISSAPLLVTPELIFNPYAGCATTKVCFGSPAGCLDDFNCQMFGAVELINGRFIFETLSQVGMAYVAFALSDDRLMGRDSVIECVTSGNKAEAFTSITIRQGSVFASPRITNQNIIRLVESRIDNGRLYCRVERDNITTIDGIRFDLVNDKHFLLLAQGTELDAHTIGSHGPWRKYSRESALLSEPRNLEPGGTRVLVMVHGSFMIVAWIGTAAAGIFIGRYFKKTWTSQKICGKDVWFVCHSICMLLTWILVISSYIIIFIDVGEWRTSVHAVVGSVTTALLVFQPIGAIFRPAPISQNRPIFNFIHSSMGNFIHFLALVTIFFAIPKPSANLPRWTFYILIGFIVFYLKMHFLMTLIGTYGDIKRQKDLGSKKEAPFTLLRKTLLGFFLIVILLFVIALEVILTWP